MIAQTQIGQQEVKIYSGHDVSSPFRYAGPGELCVITLPPQQRDAGLMILVHTTKGWIHPQPALLINGLQLNSFFRLNVHGCKAGDWLAFALFSPTGKSVAARYPIEVVYGGGIEVTHPAKTAEVKVEQPAAPVQPVVVNVFPVINIAPADVTIKLPGPGKVRVTRDLAGRITGLE